VKYIRSAGAVRAVVLLVIDFISDKVNQKRIKNTCTPRGGDT
jgi:hypothetical protein